MYIYNYLAALRLRDVRFRLISLCQWLIFIVEYVLRKKKSTVTDLRKVIDKLLVLLLAGRLNVQHNQY